MVNTGERIAAFLNNLRPRLKLPAGVTVMNPYAVPEVRSAVAGFCASFYGKKRHRTLILGINPGRFGAGITGVAFTDPVALETHCGIANSFPKKQELSSRFIYEMIDAYGGVHAFYDRFILSAVCPLGFLHGIKNFNYYDSPVLLKSVKPFIRESLREHFRWNVSETTVISLGKKNASFLEAFNRELKLFENIITLEHPRFVMQYRQGRKQEYIDSYCNALHSL